MHDGGPEKRIMGRLSQNFTIASRNRNLIPLNGLAPSWYLIGANEGVLMSGLFEDRERGYEAKWAHDQETHFKVLARRDSLAGYWAASLLNLGSAAADAYAGEIVKAGVAAKSRDPVFEKIRDDFKNHNIDCAPAVIHRKLQELFEAASRELGDSAGPR
jgi:hypothetical protein